VFSAVKSALLAVGTRPEVIKMFSVARALAARGVKVETVAVLQQRELLLATFEALGWQPDQLVERGSSDFSLAEMMTGVTSAVAEAIEARKPDVVVVQGDTTTAFAAALAAFYARIPVAHVEAGLRTWNLAMPFPEEAHRALIDQIADVCLAPTPSAAENLRRAGIPESRIVITGNTVIDALRAVRAELPPRDRFTREGLRTVVVTCHRRENFGPGVLEVCAAVKQIAERHADVHFVVTSHPNPNVARHIEAELTAHPAVRVVSPLPYREFVHLLADAWLILTDSGGIQEEATSLGKPFLILREVTERPEAIGPGLIVDPDAGAIARAFDTLSADRAAYDRMAKPSDVFGDGLAGERSADAILALFGR